MLNFSKLQITNLSTIWMVEIFKSKYTQQHSTTFLKCRWIYKRTTLFLDESLLRFRHISLFVMFNSLQFSSIYSCCRRLNWFFSATAWMTLWKEVFLFFLLLFSYCASSPHRNDKAAMYLINSHFSMFIVYVFQTSIVYICHFIFHSFFFSFVLYLCQFISGKYDVICFISFINMKYQIEKDVFLDAEYVLCYVR